MIFQLLGGWLSGFAVAPGATPAVPVFRLFRSNSTGRGDMVRNGYVTIRGRMLPDKATSGPPAGEGAQ